MAGRRVLLVNPRICSPRSARMPLSLLSLAAVLDRADTVEFVDGNLDPDAPGTVANLLRAAPADLVAVTVMPGPQVGPAIAVSQAARSAAPGVPIAWGGYFPSMYPEAAINATYVDYVVRGEGQQTLLDLLAALPAGRPPGPHDSGGPDELAGTRGLTWKRDGVVVHGPDRPFAPPDTWPDLPYQRLPGAARYLQPTALGRRLGFHQAAIGCRYRCSFCGVVSLYNGHTASQSAGRLRDALGRLRREYGADSWQFVDNNFFDTEANSQPALEVLAEHGLPWWCYARTDTLAGFSAATWRLVQRSGLRMAFLGAEAGSDEALARMRKGTRAEQTLEAAARCREHGVIPELSFVLGGPDDPAGEVERTLRFIRQAKRVCPTAEIILYLYSPTPQRDAAARRADPTGLHLPQLAEYGPAGPPLPTTPEEWCEPRWIDYVCHRDAPWLDERLKARIRDFGSVLGCRFPTVQDVRTPRWGKRLLAAAALPRWASRRYDRPRELDWLRRRIPLKEPQSEGL
ncbi:MAG: B12-binding domain-containing radical SAM protein [Fimbriimonadaceae bacterium]|nr:B12-binding domain-containing radical SAM protein [Fimbriimonadaceae bacterium]